MTIQHQEPLFNTVGIIGVGLIGGSLGLALKKAGIVKKVLGTGRTKSNLDTAIEHGLIDHIVELPELAKQSDLIIVCAPVAQTSDILRGIIADLKTSAIIIDVGSTKMDVVQSAKEVLGEKIHQFIPCHPIAGGASHGASAAKVDLFENKQVILCPLLENRTVDIDLIESTWKTIGAKVYKMAAVEHDHLFAAVSHLPHLLSYALMLQIANADDAQKKFVHAGAGFRDFTRIAGSSPEMWTDISLANRVAILKELEAYLHIIEHMKKAIVEEDAKALQKMFQLASDSRNQWQG